MLTNWKRPGSRDIGGKRPGGRSWLGLAFLLFLTACSTDPSTAKSQPVEVAEAGPAPDWEPVLGIAPFLQPWIGDLDGMVERRLIRVLTVNNPVLYSIDRGREIGINYELAEAFEDHVNKSLGSGHIRVHVLLLPVERDELIPRLLKGEGDIAAAQLTITPARLDLVDFSLPFGDEVSEIVVTGPGTPPMTSLSDLSGREVFVRASSSYAEHLLALNQRFEDEGRPPVDIKAAAEELEDGDILEMVAADLMPATVVDNFMAQLWAQLLPNLVLHPEVEVNRGGKIAWAFRKQSPKLAAMLNDFVPSHRQGSLAGNVLIKKYLQNTKWLLNARSKEHLARFREMVDLFRKYADQYHFDYLLMAAQGYQESQFDQRKRSAAGAIGVMQLLPSTASGPSIGIPNIDELEANIHAGIKYDRWIVDNFFDDPGLDSVNRGLFVLAAYNAGPGRVKGLRREAAAEGLDPNRWFNNVEIVAARRIGRETVQYVGNVYKYYLAYKMLAEG